MTYAYDLLLNFNKEMYDFYDWKDTDTFIHARKIPLIKVSTKSFIDILSKKVRFKEELLNRIKNKTQIYTINLIENVDYEFIITNGENAVALHLDSKGYVKEKSKLLINEEQEVIDLITNLQVMSNIYNVVSNKVTYKLYTRNKEEQLIRVLNELDLIKEDKEKIDYLYKEYFNDKKTTNKYNDLVKDINKILDREDILETINILFCSK